MASILDRYGIKEVADFTFYNIGDDGKPTNPVLYLDTLKVSTIEQTADVVDAKGGKGNTTLLSWDQNKEINVTLEDALFSAKSLAIMFGNGKLKNYTGDKAWVMKSETFVTTDVTLPTAPTETNPWVDACGWKAKYEGPNGKLYTKVNPKFYDEDGVVAPAGSTVESGKTYFCSYDILVSDGKVIEMGASEFPGTYYCVGDTYARNEKTGKDEFFQFIIPKAKVQASNTLTLQADGDPSTFNMTLKVLRPIDGIMMKLIKYNASGTDASTSENAKIDHNHYLKDRNLPPTNVEG